MNWKQFTSLLTPGQDVMLLVHERPDGDAWGSAFGLGMVLESLGYNTRFVRPAANISKRYSWLPGQHLIDVVPTDVFHAPEGTAVMVLDCGDHERCEYDISAVQVLLNADHHVSNPEFGELNWVDRQAGATAQVLCGILLEAGVTLPKDAATCFYFAMVTDTGSFRFSSTSATTLRIASDLVERGADLDFVRRNLWENRPSQELTLLQAMLKTMITLVEGRGVLCYLPYETVIESGIHDTDTDTALDMLRSIEEVEAVLLLKESEPGIVKFSIRTKDLLDGAAFMSRIGGGGHLRAAGATFYGSLPDALEKAVELMSEALINL